MSTTKSVSTALILAPVAADDQEARKARRTARRTALRTAMKTMNALLMGGSVPREQNGAQRKAQRIEKMVVILSSGEVTRLNKRTGVDVKKTLSAAGHVRLLGKVFKAGGFIPSEVAGLVRSRFPWDKAVEAVHSFADGMKLERAFFDRVLYPVVNTTITEPAVIEGVLEAAPEASSSAQDRVAGLELPEAPAWVAEALNEGLEAGEQATLPVPAVVEVEEAPVMTAGSRMGKTKRIAKETAKAAAKKTAKK